MKHLKSRIDTREPGSGADRPVTHRVPGRQTTVRNLVAGTEYTLRIRQVYLPIPLKQKHRGGGLGLSSGG